MIKYENRYTVSFQRPNYNSHHSYFQNENRRVGSRVVDGIEAAKAFVAECVEHGCTNISVYNVGGKKVAV